MGKREDGMSSKALRVAPCSTRHLWAVGLSLGFPLLGVVVSFLVLILGRAS
jgi:hypothetical protein